MVETREPQSRRAGRNQAALALVCAGLLWAGGSRCQGAVAPVDAAGADFFEKHIRPALIEHCYSCHSKEGEKGVKGGLRLDDPGLLLKGGESGPAIVPGHPERSLLIKAIEYADENLQMPPKGARLEGEVVAQFRAWIQMGAPDPRSQARIPGAEAGHGYSHWAFQPIRSPPPPRHENSRRIETPVDAFILARLQAEGLRPASRADPRTLVRRLFFDLHGLPPDPEEVERFERDPSPRAYAALVDRLLASHRYGERWARHWLDIARYADTKGYVFEEERRYPYAYTYRDYVIRAFNEDLPFDRFIMDQLAADLLPEAEDKRHLAALGFLTLGRRFLNNPHDIIDDRIDVVTRGLMGLTVTCARCHDHKYDPIPLGDYYSLYGVFASTHEPSEKPLLGTLPAEYSAYQEEHQRRVRERDEFRASKNQEILAKLRGQIGDYLIAAHDAASLAADQREALARKRQLDPGVLRRWHEKLAQWAKEGHPIFGPWIALAALETNAFATAGARVLESLSGSQPVAGAAQSDAAPARVNARVLRALTQPASPASIQEAAARYQELFNAIDELARNGAVDDAKGGAPTPALDEALRAVLYSPDYPVAISESEIRRLYDVPTAQKSRALQRKVEELDATHPGAPPRAMALLDNATPSNPRVFIRGNPNNPGPAVPRQFLEVLAGSNRQPFAKGSGRLELAEAITSADNPLTARVWVNRVWALHFGAPLVRTPSDFGLRSEPPTHPELLDYLASRFIAEGWSMKKLHRSILLSATYQQSSQHDAASYAKDPANTLLWRMNRRRLDLEAMRDTLLAVAGRLEEVAGGQAVDILTPPFSGRRTIFGFIERQNLPAFFRTFDFASPDTTSPQRFATSVPQQALFLMNSPFVIEQSRRLVNRVRDCGSDAARVAALYRAAYQRLPRRDELGMALEFLAREPAAEPLNFNPSASWRYGYGRFEEASGRTAGFAELPHYAEKDKAWRGGAKLPDPKLSWTMLTASGGHPGERPELAVVRRWISPVHGSVRVSGKLSHAASAGDGVRARVVSSRSGLAGEWTAHNRSTEASLESVAVERGDTLDFVVDARDSIDSDSFEWAPRIEYAAPAISGGYGILRQWDAREDFSGPRPPAPRPLDHWEQLAQVLLLSNELMFVD